MKKSEFITELRRQLAALPSGEVEDIVRDQEEYIADAMAAGRTEEQAVAALGEPKAFAASLSAEAKIKKIDEAKGLQQQVSGTIGAVVAILALAPLNLIFVLGPFLALVGIAIAGWAVAVAGVAAAAALILAFFFKLVFITAGFWAQVSTFFLALGSLGLSVLGLVGMYYITYWLVQGTVAYLKWNLNFVRAGAKQ